MRSKTPEKACKWTLCRDVSSAAVSKIKNYQAQICICCENNRNMNYWYDINSACTLYVHCSIHLYTQMRRYGVSM